MLSAIPRPASCSDSDGGVDVEMGLIHSDRDSEVLCTGGSDSDSGVDVEIGKSRGVGSHPAPLLFSFLFV